MIAGCLVTCHVHCMQHVDTNILCNAVVSSYLSLSLSLSLSVQQTFWTAIRCATCIIMRDECHIIDFVVSSKLQICNGRHHYYWYSSLQTDDKVLSQMEYAHTVSVSLVATYSAIIWCMYYLDHLSLDYIRPLAGNYEPWSFLMHCRINTLVKCTHWVCTAIKQIHSSHKVYCTFLMGILYVYTTVCMWTIHLPWL